MSLRRLLQKPLHTNFQSILPPRHYHLRRVRKPNAPTRRSSTSSEAQTRSRVDRVLNRLPKFLHPYTNGLRNAPVTHVVSFLILHEITAIVPLVGLAGLFHWMRWIPDVSATHIVRYVLVVETGGKEGGEGNMSERCEDKADCVV